MNILHVNTERTWRGGEQQTLYLAAGLKERGRLSEIACQPGRELARRAAAAGITVHPVAMRAEWDPLAILRLRSLIERRAVDVVHMHTSHAHFLGVIAARLAGRRPATIVARRVDFSIHRHPFSLSGLKYRFGVDAYVAVSRAIKEVLARDGVDPGKIAVVHSGIDPSRLGGADGSRLREEFGLPRGTPVVGTVAHFAWHKGLEFLVDAAPLVARDVPGARIFIVGEGNLVRKIKERARERRAADHIVFTGFRPDVPDFLDLFDVFVMPSLMEGLCTSILDALILEKPVVASRVGGIPEIIEEGATGLLVPPGDGAALAAAIVRLLREPELGRELAARGREKVERDFSIAAMVEGNIRIYESVLSGRRGG